ncbi:MAG: SEC-C metal-binding domain-containing protein [Candidatus Magasanikbacteria bacterium]
MNKKVGRNDPCPCGNGKKYKKCHMNKRFEVGVLKKLYQSDVGDDFYTRFIMGHCSIRSCVYEKNEQLEYDKSFGPVLQNLVEMKMVKDKCLNLITKHIDNIQTGEDGKYHGNQIDINEPIDDDLNIFFKDFFIRGQMAIQALIKHSRYMGSNIGFLFSDDQKKFRKGSEKFVLSEKDERFQSLISFIKNNNTVWYASFRELRRQIEHEGWALPELRYSLDKSLKVKVDIPSSSSKSIKEILETYWDNMNIFCEEVITFLLSLKLKDDMVMVYIPKEKRDQQMPVRYMASLKEFPGVPLQC